jgi:peptide/nickel transport system substrate-binding protein
MLFTRLIHNAGRGKHMVEDIRGRGLDRRQLLRTGALAGAVLLGGPTLLSACTPAGSADPAPGGTPVKGGTLTVGVITAGQAEAINPAIAAGLGDQMRSFQIFEGLFQIGPDGSATPWLAESAEPNADATVWTFHLRKNATWHNGTPFTADDVIYNIQTWADPSSALSSLTASVIDTSGLKKLDDHTVQVPLKIGFADFPAITAQYYCYMVPKGTQTFKTMANPVGTGPFKFKSFTPGSRSEFTANPDYWGGAPYLDAVIVDSSYTDENSRTNALLAGSIDAAPRMSFALAKNLGSQSGNVRVASAHTPQPYYIPCRVDQAPFNDPRVMQALKLVVDQNQFVTSVFNGYATTTPHLPLKSLKHYMTNAPTPTQDLDKAKSLLKAAGQSDLTIELSTSSAIAGFVEMAILYASQAKQAGITVNIKQIDPTLYYNTASGGGQWLEYPMMAESSGALSSLPSIPMFYLANLGYNGFPNETHWGDADTQKQALDAIGETDQNKAQDKWNAVQQLQLDRGGYIFPGTIDAVDAFSTKVGGCDPTTAGNMNNYDLRKAWKTA